jgi:hypothetical protein
MNCLVLGVDGGRFCTERLVLGICCQFWSLGTRNTASANDGSASREKRRTLVGYSWSSAFLLLCGQFDISAQVTAPRYVMMVCSVYIVSGSSMLLSVSLYTRSWSENGFWASSGPQSSWKELDSGNGRVDQSRRQTRPFFTGSGLSVVWNLLELSNAERNPRIAAPFILDLRNKL